MENEEKPEQSQANILHYVAHAVLVVALGVVGYLYVDAKNQNLLNENRVQKASSFADLPLDIQKEYKSISEYKSLQTRLENIEERNEKLSTINRNKKPTLKTQSNTEKDSETLDEVPKNAKLVKEFASCYDMEMGSYIISWKCKKSIISFVDKHKDASYFEIIPMVDDAEFSLYKNLENNDFIYEKLNTTKQSINKMKKLSQAGLAKHRAIEANWVIKAHTDKKAKVYSANYHLMSHNENRGVLVRAYQ